MLEVSVTFQNGPEVMARLNELAKAAAVIGASKIEVGTSDPVGLFVEGGTKAHIIYPRAKQALYWPGAAHPVGVVHHPGTKANPFLERAMTKVAPAAEALMTQRLDMVAAGAGSNYAQIMPAVGKLVLAAAQAESPVGPTTPTRVSGTLRASLYLVS